MQKNGTNWTTKIAFYLNLWLHFYFNASNPVSDPICESSLGNDSLGVKEDTVVELQCNVSFFGKDLHPVMIWYRNNDEKLKPQNVIQTETSIFQKVKLQMTASDNGKVFSCMLYFESKPNDSVHQTGVIRAKNPPEYNFRWNFSASVYRKLCLCRLHLSLLVNFIHIS